MALRPPVAAALVLEDQRALRVDAALADRVPLCPQPALGEAEPVSLQQLAAVLPEDGPPFTGTPIPIAA